MADKVHVIAYYGAKSNLRSILLPVLNNDTSTTFVSLFTGGGILESQKKPHKVEVWNDTLHGITNFYWTFQAPELKTVLMRKINATCYSEIHYRNSKHIYNKFKKSPPTKNKDKIDFAWATWCQCNMTFSAKINGGFAFSNKRCSPDAFFKRKLALNEFTERIKKITIMNRDATEVYKLFNKPDTLFYADPPYIGSDCGHYKGYTEADFVNLLTGFINCKGRFILSSYPSDILKKFSSENNWRTMKIDQPISAGHKDTRTIHLKTEIITTNFETDGTISLFQ